MLSLSRRLRVHIGMATHGDMVGRQLDVYARRDPQLAPYVLRQVDKEFQRSCSKAKYVFWLGIFVAGCLYDMRIESELGFFLQPYLNKLAEFRVHELDDYAARQKCASEVLMLLERAKNDPSKIKEVRKAIKNLEE